MLRGVLIAGFTIAMNWLISILGFMYNMESGLVLIA